MRYERKSYDGSKRTCNKCYGFKRIWLQDKEPVERDVKAMANLVV